MIVWFPQAGNYFLNKPNKNQRKKKYIMCLGSTYVSILHTPICHIYKNVDIVLLLLNGDHNFIIYFCNLEKMKWAID